MPDNACLHRFLILLLCFILILTSGCSTKNTADRQDPVQEQDDLTLITENPHQGFTPESDAHPAIRIISQNDDATEMLIAIGAAETIVGISDTAMKKPYLRDNAPDAVSIGDWLFPDLEIILALKPDAIVSYSTSKPKNLEKITSANLPIVYCDAYRLNTLRSDARTLGNLTGHWDGAEKYIAFVEKYQSIIDSRLPTIGIGDQNRVYIEGYSDYSVMTERSAGGRILQALNSRNIHGNHTTDWATVNPEWVIAQNPDIIIKMANDPAKGENLTSVRQRILNREGYSTLSAVKNNRVYVLNGDIGSSPRAVIGLVYAAKAIYPEEFADIDPMDVLIEYDRLFVANTTVFSEAFSPLLSTPTEPV